MDAEGRKIFGIGLQKTGLTSLLRLMQELGFEARGNDHKQRRNFFKRHNYEAVLRYYDTAEFFCDWPTPLMYPAIFEKYGDRASFILTVRKDARTWFDSLKRHNVYAHPIKNKHHWVFGRYYPHGFEDEHIAYYERHFRDAVLFFEEKRATDRLLILRVDEPQSITKLADFLNIKIDRTQFPHANESKTDRPGFENWFKRHYNTRVQKYYGRYAPRILPAAPRQRFAIEPDKLRGNFALPAAHNGKRVPTSR